jgi:hypothetical protein
LFGFLALTQPEFEFGAHVIGILGVSSHKKKNLITIVFMGRFLWQP